MMTLSLTLYALLASRYGAQLLETRLGGVDVVELENLDADRSAVPEERDDDEDGLEVAALGVRSEPACHHQATMLRARDCVERLGPEIVAQLPERSARILATSCALKVRASSIVSD